MVYAKDIDSIEIHHVLDFLIVLIDKVVEYSTIIGAKYVVATILFIPRYPFKNKHSLGMKYMIGIFNFRLSKSKLCNDRDVDILFRYSERLGNNNLLANLILKQKLTLLLLLLGAHRLRTVCKYTIDNITSNVANIFI